jgi:hypothetical protein
MTQGKGKETEKEAKKGEGIVIVSCWGLRNTKLSSVLFSWNLVTWRSTNWRHLKMKLEYKELPNYTNVTERSPIGRHLPTLS